MTFLLLVGVYLLFLATILAVTHAAATHRQRLDEQHPEHRGPMTVTFRPSGGARITPQVSRMPGSAGLTAAELARIERWATGDRRLELVRRDVGVLVRLDDVRARRAGRDGDGAA